MPGRHAFGRLTLNLQSFPIFAAHSHLLQNGLGGPRT
jgi:hypothetical protein